METFVISIFLIIFSLNAHFIRALPVNSSTPVPTQTTRLSLSSYPTQTTTLPSSTHTPTPTLSNSSTAALLLNTSTVATQTTTLLSSPTPATATAGSPAVTVNSSTTSLPLSTANASVISSTAPKLFVSTVSTGSTGQTTTAPTTTTQTTTLGQTVASRTFSQYKRSKCTETSNGTTPEPVLTGTGSKSDQMRTAIIVISLLLVASVAINVFILVRIIRMKRQKTENKRSFDLVKYKPKEDGQVNLTRTENTGSLEYQPTGILSGLPDEEYEFLDPTAENITQTRNYKPQVRVPPPVSAKIERPRSISSYMDKANQRASDYMRQQSESSRDAERRSVEGGGTGAYSNCQSSGPVESRYRDSGYTKEASPSVENQTHVDVPVRPKRRSDKLRNISLSEGAEGSEHDVQLGQLRGHEPGSDSQRIKKKRRSGVYSRPEGSVEHSDSDTEEEIPPLSLDDDDGLYENEVFPELAASVDKTIMDDEDDSDPYENDDFVERNFRRKDEFQQPPEEQPQLVNNEFTQKDGVDEVEQDEDEDRDLYENDDFLDRNFRRQPPNDEFQQNTEEQSMDDTAHQTKYVSYTNQDFLESAPSEDYRDVYENADFEGRFSRQPPLDDPPPLPNECYPESPFAENEWTEDPFANQGLTNLEQRHSDAFGSRDLNFIQRYESSEHLESIGEEEDDEIVQLHLTDTTDSGGVPKRQDYKEEYSHGLRLHNGQGNGDAGFAEKETFGNNDESNGNFKDADLFNKTQADSNFADTGTGQNDKWQACGTSRSNHPGDLAIQRQDAFDYKSPESATSPWEREPPVSPVSEAWPESPVTEMTSVGFEDDAFNPQVRVANKSPTRVKFRWSVSDAGSEAGTHGEEELDVWSRALDSHRQYEDSDKECDEDGPQSENGEYDV